MALDPSNLPPLSVHPTSPWMETAIAHVNTGVLLFAAKPPHYPICFINGAVTDLIGHTSEDLLEQPLVMLRGVDTNGSWINLEEAIASGHSFSSSVPIARADGSTIWSTLSLYPILDAAGKLHQYVGLFQEQILPGVERSQPDELILNAVGEGIYGLDLQGRITFVNPAAARMLGWAVSELVGQSIDRILAGGGSLPLDASQLNASPLTLPSGELYHSDTEEFCRQDGSRFLVEYTRTPILHNGQMLGSVLVFQDVTERKRHEEALRESEERYALAVQGANDGIWDWNLKTDEIYFSPRWKAILGYTDNTLPNSLEAWFDCVHPDDLTNFKRELNAHLAGMTSHLEHEHRMRAYNGTYRWVLTRGLAVRDSSSRATRLAGSLTDITERKEIEAQLMHDALHDTLTGLPNRALLMDRLRHTVELSRRNSRYLYAVLFLDVDRFKVINDSLGHMAGDVLLVAIAQRLIACIRPGDTVARLGGDEFVVLLENIRDLNSALMVAERIQRALETPVPVDNQEIFITSSIGVALGGADYRAAEDLLRDADTAMYRAKSQGRARYEVFNTGMHQQVVVLMQLENDLRRAVERQELFLHYQPIISLRTFRLVGFEALLRWQHPVRGEIPPGTFIPVAEETELIRPLERWTMRAACRQMCQWQSQFPLAEPLTMHVNLSSKHFDGNLIGEIQTVLAETGLNPNRLNLEITESMLMENAELAVSLLNQLKQLGVKLSIDDFGTGYSSLSYLHRFPIDTLKVDRSFVNKLDQDAEQLAIVRTIMTLAWNLGIEVIAEGVETTKQLAQLIALQCEYGQGFHFSEPLAVEAIEALLMAGESQMHGRFVPPYLPPI